MEPKTATNLTVIVPAYNEAESVGETVRSLREQTLPPGEIIVIDDCSVDATAAVAEAAGATVLRRPGYSEGCRSVCPRLAAPRASRRDRSLEPLGSTEGG